MLPPPSVYGIQGYPPPYYAPLPAQPIFNSIIPAGPAPYLPFAHPVPHYVPYYVTVAMHPNPQYPPPPYVLCLRHLNSN
jgi:hypothetical protein